MNFSHAIHLYIIILYMSYMSCQDSLHIIFTTCHPRMIYMSSFYIPSYYHPRINCMLSFACHLRIDYMASQDRLYVILGQITCYFSHVILGQITFHFSMSYKDSSHVILRQVLFILYFTCTCIYIYIYIYIFQMPNMLVVN